MVRPRRWHILGGLALVALLSSPWSGGWLVRPFVLRAVSDRLGHRAQVRSCRLGLMRIVLEDLDIEGLGHIDDVIVGRRDVVLRGFRLALERQDVERLLKARHTQAAPEPTHRPSRRIVFGPGAVDFHDAKRHVEITLGNVAGEIVGRSGTVKLSHIEAKLPLGATMRLGGLELAFSDGQPQSLAVHGGELTLWRGLALTGIEGTVIPTVAVSGGYGGVPQPLWRASGVIEWAQRRADVGIEAVQFTLDKLAPLLGRDTSILAPEKAEVRGRLDVSVRKGQVGFGGQLEVRGLDIGNKAIGAQPVKDLSFGARIAGTVQTETRRFELYEAQLEHDGIQASLQGSYDASGDRPRLAAQLRIPRASCQKVLTALPRPLVPVMADFRLDGQFETDLAVSIDWNDLESLTLDGKVGIDGCKVISAPPEAAAERLAVAFDHRVEVEPGYELDFQIGPGNPDFAPFASISPFITGALMTTEDNGFFKHRGFIKSEFRSALIRNLERGSFRVGASSITMQTVKNVLLSREKTLSRKFQELFLTWYLEKKLPKERIFEIYLNAIEFGPGIYGIGRAMHHYFGKTPAQATPREAAFFSSILPSPKRRYVHYCHGQLTDKWEQYLNRILRRMHERERLTNDEYVTAISSRLAFDRVEAKSEKECLEYVKRLTTSAPVDTEVDLKEVGGS